MSEFNLSNKIKEINVIGEYLIPKNVKEFIKRREIIIQEYINKEISCAEMWIELRKLAGDKLK